MNVNVNIRKLAEKLVVKAGQVIIDSQSTASITSYKDRQDICTTADLQAEKIIIDGIQDKYPEHQILSEEAGLIGPICDYKWIIDPLDGTKEFIRNIPQYNSSIAVEKNGEIVAAAIYRPTDKTLYSASLGNGAFLNGQSIHVSTVTSLADSFIYCYLPAYNRNPEKYAEAWDKLGKLGTKIYRLRSYADENMALCWLGQGAHEGFIDIGNTPKWHDVAPGILVAREAGAYIPDDLVDSIRSGQSCSIIIANNVTIYQEIQKILL